MEKIVLSDGHEFVKLTLIKWGTGCQMLNPSLTTDYK